MEKYIVDQGECIESIAYDHGFFPNTLWNLAENAELKQKRQDHLNILLPEDEVFIPDKQEKLESGATEQRHRFKRKGVPSEIHIIVKKGGQPRANEPYTLIIDGEIFSDTTNSQGEVIHPISPVAKSGKLTVGEGENAVEYILQLGHMDPIDEVSGVQGRLNNLGFYHGPLDGQMTQGTIQALKAFQEKAGLSVTGEIDQATQDALEQEHQS